MPAADARPLTPSRLRRGLQRLLKPPLRDVLLPAMQLRASTRRMNVILPNPAWEAVFLEHCREHAERLAQRHGMELRVVCRETGDDPERSREQTLANFLRDPGNQFALSACQQALAAPGVDHNPLYLHGPPGCGKTHLIRALAREFREILAGEQVLEIAGSEWVSHLARAYGESGSGGWRERLDNAAVICFDGVDVLAQRTLAQEQLFHLINATRDRGQQIVVTGLAPTRRLMGIEERLATRLAWGLTVPMDVPLLETRLALLRGLLGPTLDELEGQDLARLVEALAPDMRQVVTLAGRLMRGERPSLGSAETSFDRILEAVAAHFDLRPADIAGKRQNRMVAQARQLCLLLGRRLTSHSLVALGGMVGGRDHSTVLYSIRQAEQRLKKDPDFTFQVNMLSQRILGR